MEKSNKSEEVPEKKTILELINDVLFAEDDEKEFERSFDLELQAAYERSFEELKRILEGEPEQEELENEDTEPSPEDIAQFIEEEEGVMIAADTVISSFNVQIGSLEELLRRHDAQAFLRISVINLSKTQRIVMDGAWFRSGGFWEEPSAYILKPKKSISFYVWDKKEVSGGLGFTVTKADGTTLTEGITESRRRWICTFSRVSNGREQCFTSWADPEFHLGSSELESMIHTLLGMMDGPRYVLEDRCSCQRREPNHVVYIWKDPESPWI